MKPSARQVLVCALAVLLAGGPALGQAEVGGGGAGGGGGGGGADGGVGEGGGTSRLLRFFDFDERKLGNPEELPMNWSKVVGPGLPHYVNGRLVPDMGRSSGFSFRFDLNGGSLIYRYDTGQIVAKKGAKYRVETFVKTTALENARARVSAFFVDQDNRPMPETTVRSPLFVGTGPNAEWTPLTVELTSQTSRAAWLVVQLELLQPSMYTPSSAGARALFNQDVAGTAWFTDVSVAQVPEVRVLPEQPGAVFPRGTPVRLWLTVTDANPRDLGMRLEVRSADGTLVHQRTGPLDLARDDRGVTHRMPILIPTLPTGWYEARVTLTSLGKVVADERQAFVQLADDGALVIPDPRFGVIATQLNPDRWQTLPDLLPVLGSGRVKISVWGENTDIQTKDAREFERLITRFQSIGVLPTACITALPPEIAAVAGGSSLAKLPGLDGVHWRPRLSLLIARHANLLDRWQLGRDGQEEFVTDPAHRQAYDMIYAAFSELVTDPDLAIPWPATFETDRKLPSTIALALLPAVLPDQVPMYIQDMKDRGGRKLSLTLVPLDDRYGRETRLRDFAQRLITALAGGSDRVDVPLPFTPDGQPEELLLAMRTLNRELAGGVFRGKLKLADNTEAFLFEAGGKGCLIMWDQRTTTDPTAVNPVKVNLGGRPRLVDLMGDSSNLPQVRTGRDTGQVTIPLGNLPVVVQGIDPAMAMFRVSVGLDNPLIESSFKPHFRKVTFVNTFPEFVSGSVRINAPRGWTVTPAVLNFSLNPGETFSREVQLEIPYNSLAGTRPLDLAFSIPSTTPSEFNVPVETRLGLNDIGLQTVAVREGKDVVVQLLLSNYGTKPISYSTFALFPGQPRQERLVTGLGPGRTTVKRFRFSDVVAPEGARRIRVGLREVDGTRILNDEVAIP
jgi:hypothetical protein